MSDSRILEEVYADGLSKGYAIGEFELTEGLGETHDRLKSLTDLLEVYSTRESRAYGIGFLRGYRDAVRTKRNGRWGT